MKHLALGRLPKGERNNLEAEYEHTLELLKRGGSVIEYIFHPGSLRLAPNTRYEPDFMVMREDRVIEIHEVKGRWMDDARVKIKVAAEKFWMFRFFAVTKRPKSKGGGWEYESFGGVNRVTD